MKIHSFLTLTTIIFLGFLTKGYASCDKIEETIFNAEDYGVLPNTFENVSSKIFNLLEQIKPYPNTKLVFLEGRYDLWPEGAEKREYFISNTSTEKEVPSKIKTIGLLLENFKNLTIEGNGSLFMIHGKMINFAFVHSENITLQNIHFDYERPTMSEFTFEEVTENHVIANINPSSTYYIQNNKFYWYGEGWRKKRFHSILVDSKKSISYYAGFTPFLKSKAEEISPFKVRFTGDFSKARFKKGQTLTVRDPYRDQVGAFIAYSKNIKLENVYMHYMHGMGVIAQFSENLTYDKVFVKPRKETGRKIAAFADCFHFSGCRGKISILNCETSGSHDDAVNVHGTHLKITEILKDNQIKVRFMHGQTYGFDAFFKRDSLDFVNHQSLKIKGQGIVQAVKKISEREIILTLAAKVPEHINVGDVVENVTWTPSLHVKSCHFQGSSTRGILVSTRKKVVIENNTFYRMGMHGILIANDAASWYESGPVRDVTIKNNHFIDNAYNNAPNNYAINIWPENHKIISNEFVHSNITIEGNTFEMYDHLVLNSSCVNGLVFRNNSIIKTNTFPAGDEKRPAFNFLNCKNVIISKNKITHDKVKTVTVEKMKKRDLKIEKAQKLTIKRN